MNYEVHPLLIKQPHTYTETDRVVVIVIQMGQEMMMMMMMKKGPWTEEEDIQLVLFVNLYGDRRWDFIAKVSGLKVAGDKILLLLIMITYIGLKRTGKSCRLRWVNYLHPDLKRGKMTPQEETLVLELHSRWGNRWSRIARKLPGRTDNEIKNYWRTLMRKNTQEKKHINHKHKHVIINIPSSPISNFSSSSSSSSNHVSCSMLVGEGDERSFFDTGGLEDVFAPLTKTKEEDRSDIWKHNNNNNTDLMETQEISPLYYYGELEGCNFSYQTMPSPIWDKYSPGSLWNINTEESKVFAPTNDQENMYMHG